LNQVSTTTRFAVRVKPGAITEASRAGRTANSDALKRFVDDPKERLNAEEAVFLLEWTEDLLISNKQLIVVPCCGNELDNWEEQPQNADVWLAQQVALCAKYDLHFGKIQNGVHRAGLLEDGDEICVFHGTPTQCIRDAHAWLQVNVWTPDIDLGNLVYRRVLNVSI